jgi:hypothetical protein
LRIHSLKREQTGTRCDVIADAHESLSDNAGERCPHRASCNLELKHLEVRIRAARRSFRALEIGWRRSILISQTVNAIELLLREITICIRALRLRAQKIVIYFYERGTPRNQLTLVEQ